MPILIDGHNLIGAGVFDDIQLRDEDDEAKLVARLRVWKSRYRGKITVIFDRGVPGGINHNLSGAGVDVVFAADPAQADDLIRRRLRRAAHDLILVSNDDALVREAHRYGVETCNGYQFVTRFTLKEPTKLDPDIDPDLVLGEEEVQEWLTLFNAQKRKRRRTPTKGTSARNGAKPAGRSRTSGKRVGPSPPARGLKQDGAKKCSGKRNGGKKRPS